MNWSDVLADPSLHDLPYKIELNQHGAIVMTPASNRHGWLQTELAFRLRSSQSEGRVQVECSIDTANGVKVADVAWMSDAFVADQGETTPFGHAPELCIEVVSPSNSAEEMQEKTQLYLQQGAQEVWLCSEAGQVEFFAASGPLKTSHLFPAFPTLVK